MKNLFIKKTILLIALVCCWPTFAQEEGHDGHQDTPAKLHPFFANLKGGLFANEVPITFEQAVDSSEVIVQGHIEQVFEGSTVRIGPSEFLPGLKMALVKVDISNVIKGLESDYSESVYFEFPSGVENIEDLRNVPYTDEILIFLQREQSWFTDQVKVASAKSKEITEDGIQTYSLTTPSTLFAVDEDATGRQHFVSPLGDGRNFGNFYSDFSSVEAVVSTIERRVSE